MRCGIYFYSYGYCTRMNNSLMVTLQQFKSKWEFDGIYVLKLVVCNLNYIIFNKVVIEDLLVKIEYYNLQSN